MEIVAAPIVEAAAGEIANDSVSLIKRQIGYLIHYNDNIKNLKKELGNLEDKNSEVGQHVDAGKRNSHIIAPAVLRWQENVISDIQTVKEFLDNEIKRNNKCLNGMCPNLKSRYSLSRKATKMATEIVIPLFNAALNFGPISYPGPPPKMGSTFIAHGIQDFESRKSIMDGVWEALKDDDLFCISICGMGGVGKTTMVKKLVQRAEEQNLYDIIAMAVVSQKPDLKKIQGEIADRLGLSLCGETLSGRAGRLREQLMKCGKRILLIFDDVWEEIDFEAIGVPSALEKVKGYKILLTSRNGAVCNRMGSQRNFPIDVLDEGDAWDLFSRSIGNFIDQDLHDIAKKIAAECNGLPIAIVTIAGALKNEQIYTWNDVLRKLKKSNLEGVLGMEKVNFQIELSYNYLKGKEAKSCLLLCSLFPEDYNVPDECLVRYGMGLRLFEDVDNFHGVRDRVCALIDELKNSFLLLDGDYDGGYKSVKMHDVIRDVVVSIASKNEHYIVSCDALMKWPDADRCKSSTAISIICNEIKELPVDMEYPMLQLLRLECESSSGDQINKIFRGMTQLQVLNLEISSLPSSLEFPKTLRTLCLFGNLESGELPKEIGDLISLEILEIGTEYLKELPKEIALLKNLKLLDLMNIEKIDHIPSGVLSKLSKLEELYVTWEFGEWESNGGGEETNTSLRELDSLCLTALQMRVPNFSLLPHESVFRKLIRFKFFINQQYHYYGTDDEYLGKRLSIECGSVAEIKESGICSLLRTAELWNLNHVVNLRSIYELSEDGFPQLRVIVIEDCNELEYVVDATILQGIPVAVFSKLETLTISSLMNLKEIWHGSFSKPKPSEIQLPHFNSLQSIDISQCEKLEYVFPLSVARGMRQLQEMTIRDCKNMEGILYKEEVDDEEITANEVEFPNLKLLKLDDLPKLKGFWVDMKVMADSMEQPINACNENAQVISTLFPSPNWLRLSNIQELKLGSCSQLKIAFAPSVAQQLVHLRTLEIWECNKMEYVVGVADGTQEETVFPMLNSLWLRDLSELVAFCADGHVSLNCQSLQELNVEKCPKLKTFGSVRRGREHESIEAQKKHIFSSKEVSLIKNGDSSVGHVNDHSAFIPYGFMKRLLNLEELTIEDCYALKVIFSFQEHHAAVGAVNSLKELYLRGLTYLTHIWFKVPSESMGFQSLQYLTVYNCGNLIHIFPPHLPKLLVKLQRMWIRSCEKMEAIVGKEGEEAPESVLDKIEFPGLRVLELEDLPNLKSFCGGTSAVELHSLESLEIKGCNQMKSFSHGPSNTPKLKEIMVNERRYALEEDINGSMKKEVKADIMEQPNASSGTLFPSPNWLRLSNIQDLQLVRCSQLKIAFAASVAQQLVQLKELYIEECEKMEYVVGVADGSQEETVFPMLNELHLWYLSELVAFCADGHVSLNCHSLKQLHVFRCPKIKSIGGSSGLLITGRDQQSIEPQNQHLLSSKQVSLIKNGDSSVGHVNDHSAFIPYGFMERLLNLEELRIEDCYALKVIFSFQEHHAVVGVVNSLIELRLDSLTDLTHIWFKVPSEIMGFQSLQELRVYNCGNLICIFPPRLPKLLVKLQRMEIQSCEKMEAIVGKEDEEAPESVLDKIEFPGLRVLKLEDLPNLKSFCGGTSAVELHSLEGDINGSMKKEVKADIMEQPNASSGTLFPSPNWLRLSNIQDLQLVRCSQLKIAFAASVAQQLVQLKELYIEECEKMEYVVGVADGSQEETVFPMLNSLLLEDLSELVAFCADGHVSLNCHSLKELRVIRCPKIKSFGGSSGLLITGRDQQSIEPQNQHLLSSKQVSLIKKGDSSVGRVNDHSAFIPYDFMKRLLNLEELIIEDCYALKVIFSFQEHHAAVGVVNSLERLNLDGLTDLTHIWFKVPSEIMGFQSLQALRVYNCGNLIHIFPPHLPKLLVKLQYIQIGSCEKMEAIVGKEDEEAPELVLDKIEFPGLQLLELQELPNLESFCGGTSAVELQSLESLKIRECNQMRSFSYGPSNVPKLKEIMIGERRYALEGDINGIMKKEIEAARALA